jgi:hypothetical protein
VSQIVTVETPFVEAEPVEVDTGIGKFLSGPVFAKPRVGGRISHN